LRVETGYPFYGQQIGILVFNGITPRIPGDAGHSATFPFPVRYEVVEGCFMSLTRDDKKTLESLLTAVQKLKSQGIRAIAGDCGLMSLYQRELARCGLPVAASSLCQIPMLWQLVGHSGRIGVITGHSELLKPAHFTASGCEGIPVAIQGMENEPHFSQVIIHGSGSLDPESMQRDVIHATQKLLDKAPDTMAIVLECSNLATYSFAVAQYTGLLVFDIVSAVRFMEYGVKPPKYF
jgi:hypothetical protein